MSGVPRMLDDQLLHALEERWQNQGADTPVRMEPGLSEDEIDRAAAALDFDLPQEIRTLFAGVTAPASTR
jgi:cell wall assembly regulator SMI1